MTSPASTSRRTRWRWRRTGAMRASCEGDLRALPDIGPFDAALSWGNSFGYLTPPETVRSLAGFRRVVKPGGTLVLESGDGRGVDAPAPGSTGEPEYEFGGVTMTATNRTTARARAGSRASTCSRRRTARSSTGARRTTSTRPARSCGCCDAAGFEHVELRGDDGPYELGAPRMIAVAS